MLEKIISSQIEGKCIVEGYIKPGTIKILTYSNGMIQSDIIIFEVVFECLVCSPVEGMLIDVIAKNITKAGIRAEYDSQPSPIEVFVARDHHYKSSYFANVKENDKIRIRVIGQRYELNDKYISIIAELIEPRQLKSVKKPRLILED
jgi:DNA-directed RNA polymerase subunit E'/Rpb7